MTEAEWLTCTDPTKMLAYICDGTEAWRHQHRATDRLQRLFAVACCRHPAVWSLLTDERSREAVEVAERYADGAASSEDRRKAFDATDSPPRMLNTPSVPARTLAMAVLSLIPAVGAEEVAMLSWGVESPLHPLPLADLLRDIIGNPYRPVTLAPDLRTPLVLGLAEAAYEERARRCDRCGGKGRERDADSFSGYGTAPCQRCDGKRVIDDGSLDPFRLLLFADALEEAVVPVAVECPHPFQKVNLDRESGVDAVIAWGRKKNACQRCRGTGRVPHPLLASLRSEGAKFRGLWSLDAVLGRA